MQTFRKQFLGFASRAMDTVLPARCIVTGELVEVQGMVAPEAWQSLDFIAEPFCGVCGTPFDFEVEGEALCTSCLEDQPPYERARAALRYNDASRAMILGFKHADKLHAVRGFMPWLKKTGGNFLRNADYLVPVPLHRWRLVSRRYNQSALIADALAKDVGVLCLPEALMRTRATPSQGHLSIKERRKNVRRAFAVNPRFQDRIKGKNIVLIDDVYTTGATVGECTRTLLKGGASRVDVLTLARVVRSG